VTVDTVIGDVQLTARYECATVALIRIDESQETAAGGKTNRQILVVRYESQAVTTVRIASP
jgi:hypothetical protein